MDHAFFFILDTSYLVEGKSFSAVVLLPNCNSSVKIKTLNSLFAVTLQDLVLIENSYLWEIQVHSFFSTLNRFADPKVAVAVLIFVKIAVLSQLQLVLVPQLADSWSCCLEHLFFGLVSREVNFFHRDFIVIEKSLWISVLYWIGLYTSAERLIFFYPQIQLFRCLLITLIFLKITIFIVF